MHLYLCYDASHLYRSGRDDKEKIDIFLLVTTRPIAHPGWCVCIRNCVGEFGTDTEQPLVTTNVISNHLSYHHKAYYTYIGMYIQKYVGRKAIINNILVLQQSFK